MGCQALRDRTRFNPCCIGLAIAAPHSKPPAKGGGCFNPCCIGLAIAAPDEAPAIQQAILRFQSLLYWISHCGSEVLLRQALAPFSFNPCCIGLAIAALHRLAGGD